MNKLWYKDGGWEGQIEEVIADRKYIQKYIDHYCSDLFSVPEDITTDNLKEFLEIILKYYQMHLFSSNELENLGDSIEDYFYKAYYDEFPETNFPVYPKSDRRELVLHVLDKIEAEHCVLPEDVPLLIKCMNAPDEQIVNMYDIIDEYYNHFDFCKRLNQSRSYFDSLQKQRKEAIDYVFIRGEEKIRSPQPIPIRPMGIEIDRCFKEGRSVKDLQKLFDKLVFPAEGDSTEDKKQKSFDIISYYKAMGIKPR